jgi:hypothetical protein
MSNHIEVSIVMMDALRQAEDLAYRHRDSHAVVYRRSEGGRSTLVVKLAGEEVPEGAEVVTTVSRKPPGKSPGQMLMKDAVEQVVANLPQGVEVDNRAVIEFYPVNRSYPDRQPQVFCYQFFSTEGRNIGTWIPETSTDGVMPQPGFDGRGRIWKSGGITDEATTNITWMVRAAKVRDLDPGEDCTAKFIEGWRMAEEFLRGGADPSDESPNIPDEEKFNGYIDRMAAQRRLDERAITVAKPERAAPQPMRGDVTEGLHPTRRAARP